jgi:very-short-patch-repair endonuclease
MPDVRHMDHRMGGQCGERHADEVIASVARHRVVGRRQLLDAGLSRRAIERRLESGHLHRVHLGVYAVGTPDLTQMGRFLAAAMAGGPQGAVSHRSAAALWGLRPDSRREVDITLPGNRRDRPGLRLHRAQLAPHDRAEVDGIPVTAWPRTLLDLAEHVRHRDLVRAIERADRLELFDRHALDAMIARHPGRHGLRPLARALAAYDPRHLRTRSELERRALELIDAHGLPRPELNARFHGYEVDLLWRQARVVAELDGYEHHRTRAAFERDRARDLRLSAKRVAAVRLTWRAVTADAARTAAQLAALVSGARG